MPEPPSPQPFSFFSAGPAAAPVPGPEAEPPRDLEPAPAAADGWSRSWQLTRARLADRVPVAVRGRWRVPPAAAVAALAVAAALLLGAVARWAGAPGGGTLRIAPVSGAVGPRPVVTGSASGTRPVVPAPTGAGTGTAAGTPPATGLLVVDVVGQVRRPGVVRLPPGSRVLDALQAAGGPGPHAALELLNLARPVVDGEQILVPEPGQVPVAGGGGPSASGGAGGSGVLDLNRAGASELDALPGIGPVLAARIVAWRTAHGRFASVDELGEVTGIGDRLLEQLRPLVGVG